MSSQPEQIEKLDFLLDQLTFGELTADQAARIEVLATADPTICDRYIRWSFTFAGLRSCGISLESGSACSTERLNMGSPGEYAPPCSTDSSSEELFPATSPTIAVPADSLHNTFNYLSSGWPMAYLVATAMVAIGLWGLSNTYIAPPTIASKPTQFGTDRHATVATKSDATNVGRITGMVDCVWVTGSEDKLPSPTCERGASGEGSVNKSNAFHSLVSLGDHIALHSGLLEITYNTGAKVILQGPVTYEVESTNGGYLSIGRLTGKVEVEAGKGFSVHTPTATVTDLGTEFGVEVSKEGRTTSHVFRGTVELRVISNCGKAETNATILHSNESATVEKDGNEQNVVRLSTSAVSHFVREVPRLAHQVFDLVDVVAGGDGFSGRRNQGIDPTTGRFGTRPPSKDWSANGRNRYVRVTESPFVDGVFIPNGGDAPVQVDSAGHTFDGFPATNGETYGRIWAGGPIPRHSLIPQSSLLGNTDYASPGHGLLATHANSAITFNLQAIRKANPEFKRMMFVAAAGNTETESLNGATVGADLWVLVDGQRRFGRREISGLNGAFRIVVPIAEDDHFLTLAATDGGNGIHCDWTVFGDPRLEMLTHAKYPAVESQPSRHEKTERLPATTNSVRVPLALFNTGAGLRVGDHDSHWFAVAKSATPNLQPYAASVANADLNDWLENNPKRSQWITLDGPCKNNAEFTFRTTFVLDGLLPNTAVIDGSVLADNCVSAIRINGKKIGLSQLRSDGFRVFNRFQVSTGFVSGINTLEIDVHNGEPGESGDTGPMGLRVELSGSAKMK